MTAGTTTSGRGRRWLAVGGALAAIGGTVAWLAVSGASAPVGATPGARPTAGDERVYRLRWKQEQANRIVPEAGEAQLIRGELDLDGRLIARDLGRHDGQRWIGVRLAELERHRVHVMGRELIADRAAAARELESAEVIAELDDRGAIVGFQVPASASDLAASLLPVLLSSLDAPRAGEGGAADWTMDAVGPFGTAVTRFHRDGAVLVRERERYTRIAAAPAGAGDARLESSATLDVDDDGLWRRVDDIETLAVGAEDQPALTARSEVHLALERTQPASGGGPPRQALRRVRPGAPGPGAMTAAQIDRQRIGDLTAPVVLSKLAGYGAGAGIADVNDFVWRASGLLEADPAACAQLAEQLTRGEIVGDGVSLGLDLLASAGTSAAMAALRTALASPALGERDDFALLVQRLSFLDAPDDATVQFAAGLHEAHEAGTLVGGAAAYAMGAMAGKLAGAGRGDDAARLVAPLARELAATDDARTQAHLVGALGNTRMAAHREAIAGFAGSGEPAVRAAVANALRHGAGEAAVRSTLLRLSGDADRNVQTTALASLRGQTLDASEAGRLAAALAAGVAPMAAGDAVAALAPHAGASEVALALARIAADTRVAPQVRANVNRLLRGS